MILLKITPFFHNSIFATQKFIGKGKNEKGQKSIRRKFLIDKIYS